MMVVFGGIWQCEYEKDVVRVGGDDYAVGLFHDVREDRKWRCAVLCNSPGRYRDIPSAGRFIYCVSANDFRFC